jgi:hypothetical protein
MPADTTHDQFTTCGPKSSSSSADDDEASASTWVPLCESGQSSEGWKDHGTFVKRESDAGKGSAAAGEAAVLAL